MSNPQVDLLRKQLALCAEESLAAAGKVMEVKRTTQLAPGKAHATWTIGHMANTLDVVTLQWVLCQPKATPAGFGKKFAPDFSGGDPITTDPGAYPPWDEVVATYKKVTDALVEAMPGLTDADLPNPLKGNVPDAMRGFFDTNESTLMRMIRHDSYHRGQLVLLGLYAA